MPSQLQRRLARFLDATVARDVNGHENSPHVDSVAAPTVAQLLDHAVKPPHNTNRHWPGGVFGQAMNGVQSIMIHGTSGWPSYASADNFRERYECVEDWGWSDNQARWTNSHAIGTQYFIDPNGTIFALIGPENLEGTARFTWHSNAMSFVSLGIEQADGGDSGAIVPANNPQMIRRLNPNTAAATDLAGMKLFAVLHPFGAEDVILQWFAVFPDYDGPGDIADMAHRYGAWKNTLFSERDYRSLALLCRFLAERNGLPRNFPLFPWASSEFDTGNAALFRRMLTADPLRDQIAAALGLTAALQGTAAAFAAAYGPTHARLWSRFFGVNGNARSTPCFRGLISHLINGGHRCPGPLFDWHRFAREVWDWWWYPFDFRGTSTTGGPLPFETFRRPYQRARGDTPLVEYYFDAIGAAADYTGQQVALSTFPEYNVSADVPIYAMANGIAIAARVRGNADAGNPGFLLVRHEVFHQGANGRIDYDLAPTTVWSLVTFILASGFTLDNVSASNPDWLNRFVMRLRECELAVAFRAANPNIAALNRGWVHPTAATPGAGTRPPTGTLIERDAAEYRRIANDLIAGQVVRFPRQTDDNLTTVRVLLGDYLGTPAALPVGVSGIQLEIFSADKLNVPGATFGPISANGQDWWRGVVAASQAEAVPAGGLPSNGQAWHYSLTSFLEWVNTTTWNSEWPKYGALDPVTHAPVPTSPRPNSRLGISALALA
jgi:hypothetical protein